MKELFNAHPYPFHLASVIVNILAYFCQHVTMFDLVDVVPVVKSVESVCLGPRASFTVF